MPKKDLKPLLTDNLLYNYMLTNSYDFSWENYSKQKHGYSKNLSYYFWAIF